MKKILLLILTLSTFIWAKEEIFYFVAKSTPEGTYLRWDALESNFENNQEINKLILKRDGQTIATFLNKSIMSQEKIKKLYQKPENSTSLKRVIAAISANDDPSCHGANLSNFAEKITKCMQNNMWRMLMSKTDFNIATIGHRAYLDKIKKNALVNYELLAVKTVNGQTSEKTIGKVTVNPTVYTHILGAKNFKQVRQNYACNTPEYAKDDHTVSLSWENNGNPTDMFTNSIMLAGYDLYRSKQKINNLNLSALEQHAPTNSKGEYQFNNLEKVNAVPILLANTKDKTNPLYMETKDELLKAGLQPDDVRWYYLVAKDFTGHYGPTVSLKVTVPNLLPPVTPWAVRSVEINGSVELVWDKSDKENYLQHYKNNRKFCDRGNIVTSKRLHFVENDNPCGIKELEVNLNVERYLVYRFDTPLEAAKFSDHDLDGIGDLDENNASVCNYNQPTGSALVAELKASDFNSKAFIRFKDNSVDKSKYYWYRIATVSSSNIASILTQPIRAMIPDRTLPNKLNASLKVCRIPYRISTILYANSIATDATGKAKKIRFRFKKGSEVFYIDNKIITKDNLNILRCMYDEVRIEYIDENGELLDFFLFKPMNCKSIKDITPYAYTHTLTKNLCQEDDKVDTVFDGESIYTWPKIVLGTVIKASECLEISLNVAGKRDKILRKCKQEKTIEVSDFNLSNLGKGTQFCLGITVFNENNQHSPTTYLPCFSKVDKMQPQQPNITQMEKVGTKIQFSWMLPQEKTVSTIVSLYNEDNVKQSYLRTFVHPSHTQSGNLISKSINIIEIPNTLEKWCMKAKTVAFGGETSPWSSIRCMQRNGETEHLPWPHIDSITTPSKAFKFTYGIEDLDDKYSSLMKDQSRRLWTPIYYFDTYRDNDLRKITLNFVLYRQEKINGTWTNLTQISPLVHEVRMLANDDRVEDPKSIVPHEMTNNLEFVMDKGSALLYYVDKYPYTSESSYRYVKITFDVNHEIKEYSISNIVQTGGTQ